jgi:hypothetical protein
MIRTFVDSGVLIAAARADHTESEPALRLLEDPGRRMLTSVFVRLEVYPKTAFRGYPLQRAFLNEYFMEPALEWASDLNGLVNLAHQRVRTARSFRYGCSTRSGRSFARCR